MLRVLKRPYVKFFGISLLTGLFLIVVWVSTKDIFRSMEQLKQNHSSTIQNDLSVKLKTLLKCKNKPLVTQLLHRGEHWVLQNLIRGRRSNDMECWESMTYTTVGDYKDLEHLATVVKRWLGPISFALFAPGYDFNDTMDAIQYVRNCLPESELIRDFVSFHLYFPSEHMPDDYVPKSEKEALNWPYGCPTLDAFDYVQRGGMYKTRMNLTYPINVGRNVARKAVNTYFVFPCDIDLYPSLGFIDQFLQMAAQNLSLLMGGNKPRVFPVPVFELQGNTSLPDTKTQLVSLLAAKKAIPFRENICRPCNLVPQQNKWVEAKASDKLEILTVGKGYGQFSYWDPFYVSNNREPDFDERVTWEGKWSKRIQNYAMCLLDYEYHVLHPAFLVHAPDIQKYNSNSERMHFVGPMDTLIMSEIVPGYRILYGENKRCLV